MTPHLRLQKKGKKHQQPTRHDNYRPFSEQTTYTTSATKLGLTKERVFVPG
jgi:hypothetical protein